MAATAMRAMSTMETVAIKASVSNAGEGGHEDNDSVRDDRDRFQ